MNWVTVTALLNKLQINKWVKINNTEELYKHERGAKSVQGSGGKVRKKETTRKTKA
jgi:hypothetical protein